MTTPVTLRLDPDLLATARAEAARDSRTLTDLLELAVQRYLGTTVAPARNAIGSARGQGADPALRSAITGTSP